METNRKPIPVLTEGTLLGDRYRILSPIGRGGMGRVYLAEDVRLNGRWRALKITASPREGEEAIFREARILSELHHPNLPDIVDYFPPDEDGWAVIVMEYVAGESLGDLFVRSGRRLPFRQALRYMRQLCDLLCYLHGREPPIVFRDLKPSNVLIDRHDRAVLVDFGIARAYRPEAVADTERLGTPAFAAPEQLAGRQTDARSDLYSWGALAYHLLTGGQLAARRTNGLGRALQDDVPAGFRDLLETVLADDPADRPRSAGQLLSLLRQATDDPVRLSLEREHPALHQIDGIAVTAILSAYPGAGSTFAALGLSRWLSARGIHHALVELPGGDPELYGLLDGERNMPKHAVFANPSGQGGAVPVWQVGPTRYYPVSPAAGSALPEPGFAVWLRRLGVPLVLVDVSSRWEQPGMPEWLEESGIGSMWWVADCQPAKWSPRRQSIGSDIRRLAGQRGIRQGWIANRDHAFSDRRQWLSCFPAAPAASIPQLPPRAVIEAAWRGEGFPAAHLRDKAVERAFQAWATALRG